MYTGLDAEPRAEAGRGFSAGSGAVRLGDDAYDRLKTQLLRGEFPLNVRLSESRLAQHLKVSRTPVREALRRLASEALIEPHPDGGFRPAVPDTTVIRELYELRAALELEALQRPGRAGRRHDPAILEPLRERWRAFARGVAAGTPPEPSPDFVLHDESFHVSLSLAAGNRSATDMLRQVNERIRVVRMHDFLLPERIELTVTEHLEIVELVLTGDVLAAESAFSAHLSASMAVVEQQAAVAIARMATGGRS
jgi:DNA-binding GntR family transcriptional regulator